MSGLFGPAIVLMDRLKFPKKFLILGAIVVVNLAVLLSSLAMALMESITFARTEIQALKVIRPLMTMVQAAQQHRGLSAGVIGGARDLEDKRKAKELELDKLMQGFGEYLGPDLRSNDEWKKATAAWKEIPSQVSQWDAATSFNKHTQFIDNLLDLSSGIADAYGLMLDPEIGTYYLMETGVIKFPALLERMGRMRARGAAALAKKELSPQGRIDLGILEAEIKTLLLTTEKNVKKVVSTNPALAGSIGGAFKGMQDTSTSIVGVLHEDILSGVFSTPPKQFFALVTQAIDTGYLQLYDVVFPALGRMFDERIARAQKTMVMHLGLVAVCLLLLIYLAVGAYLAITRNLDRMARAASKIAAGDLTVRVSLHCSDELGDTANDFNRIAGAMSELLRAIQDGMSHLLDATRRLSESAHLIAESSQQQSNSASGMAAAVEQTTTSVDQIARSAQDAAGISSNAGELSTRGAETVAGVVEEMKAIAAVVNESARTIQELGAQSEQISAIVAVIKAIAEQTNLLALNAAIEAARAGEAGRGFAVVADEVRKLAERTNQSTQEISVMVGSIQQGTLRAVESMRSGVERVGSGVERAELAGSSMAEIRAGAHQVVGMVADISASLREQSAATTDMARNVEQIAEMAEHNSHSAADNNRTARELEQLANQVQDKIRCFKVA